MKKSIYASTLEQVYVPSPRTVDGLKFRYSNGFWTREIKGEEGEEEEDLFIFQVGVTSYVEFLKTNRCLKRELIQEVRMDGIKRFDDPKACFADPLGNAALVVTRDGWIPFLQRDVRLIDFGGWFDVPGGHPEPSNVGISLDMWSDFPTSKVLVEELVGSVQRECWEEMNVPLELMGVPYFVGIVFAEENQGKPSALFAFRLDMDAEQLQLAYASGLAVDADESEGMVLVSTRVVSEHHGLGRWVPRAAGDAVPQTIDFGTAVYPRLVPNAKFLVDHVDTIVTLLPSL